MCQFQNYVTLGQKINAIKELRALTGVGLKEAKDMVESLPAFAVSKFNADCNPNHEHYVVVQGMGDGTDYVTHFAGHYDNRDEALAYARGKVERNDVVVARVIAKTTRSLDVL